MSKNDYNPKLDYLFCKYSSSRKPLASTDEEEWRDVFQELKEPNDPRQVEMLRIKKVLSFIKNQECQFTKDSIITCLDIYLKRPHTPNDVDLDKLNKIINDDKTMISTLNFRDLFVLIIKEKPFHESINIEMAEIITNFLLIKQKELPVVFYALVVEKILKLILLNELEGAKILMLNLLQRSALLNKKHEFVPLDVLLEKTNRLKDILQKEYGVYSIYYFGSYSKGDANEYSDFDLFIEIDTEFPNKNNKTDFLKGYLENNLGISIDCHICEKGYVNNPLRIDMIRHLKKIF